MHLFQCNHKRFYTSWWMQKALRCFRDQWMGVVLQYFHLILLFDLGIWFKSLELLVILAWFTCHLQVIQFNCFDCCLSYDYWAVNLPQFLRKMWKFNWLNSWISRCWLHYSCYNDSLSCFCWKKKFLFFWSNLNSWFHLKSIYNWISKNKWIKLKWIFYF